MQNEQTDKGLYSIIVTLRKRLFVYSSSYLFVSLLVNLNILIN